MKQGRSVLDAELDVGLEYDASWPIRCPGAPWLGPPVRVMNAAQAMRAMIRPGLVILVVTALPFVGSLATALIGYLMRGPQPRSGHGVGGLQHLTELDSRSWRVEA
jgi:hypothetical protein